MPEKLLGLKIGEAFIFRTIAGHPQPVLRDILTLDAQSRDFEDLTLVYHTDDIVHTEDVNCREAYAEVTDCGAHYFDVDHIRSELISADFSAEDEIGKDTFGTITTR